MTRFISPEEFRAHQERLHMESVDVMHGIYRTLGEMPEEHLRSVIQLLHICANGGEGVVNYYWGVAAGIVRERFDVCPPCGVNHSTELFQGGQAADSAAAEPPPTNFSSTPVVSESGQESPPHQRPEASSSTILIWKAGEPNPLNLTDEDRANMEVYHLEDTWDTETRRFKGFACTGLTPVGPCGVVYVSIEDRMLKAPDDCHGCAARGRWG
jgi:hypothetical protein